MEKLENVYAEHLKSAAEQLGTLEEKIAKEDHARFRAAARRYMVHIRRLYGDQLLSRTDQEYRAYESFDIFVQSYPSSCLLYTSPSPRD